MAAALWAVREWAQSSARARSRIRWTFLALMGEEAGNDGAHAMANKGFSSDLTLVLEPTQLGVVTAHKGALWLEVDTTGVACHGSTPDKGRNAIYAMRRVLEIIEEKIIPELAAARARQTRHSDAQRRHHFRRQQNQHRARPVPHRNRLPRRAGHRPGEISAAGSNPNCALSCPRSRCACSAIRRRSIPMNRCRGCDGWARRPAASPPRPGFPTPPCSAARDCPAVCIGPGSIAQAHTKDEFILLQRPRGRRALFPPLDPGRRRMHPHEALRLQPQQPAPALFNALNSLTRKHRTIAGGCGPPSPC